MQPTCESVTDAPAGPQRRLSTRGQLVLATCACAGATAFLYAVDPSRHPVYPPCPIYQLTGIYCAGCGATRAIHALLHGRVLAALHDNALFVATLPLLLFVVGSYALTAWRGNAWPKVDFVPRSLTRYGVGFVALLLVFTLLRNLPGWPFELLKPLVG